MTWLLPVLAGWALLGLPGLALLLAAGARPPLRWGWAPVTTVLAAVPLAAVLRVLGIRWSIASLLIGIAVLCLILLGVRWLRSRRSDGGPVPRAAPRTSALITATAVFFGLATVAAVASRMGGISTLNGSYDAFFHLSSIAFIRDGGDAFAWTALEGIYGEPTYYPVAFDSLAALLPFDTATSANALMLACLAAIPSSVGAMVATVVPGHLRRPLPVLCAMAASTLFLSTAAMALVMGLWPIVLGTVCLPPAVAAVLRFVNLESPLRPRPMILLAAATAGAALAHPSVLFSAMAVLGVGVLVRGVLNLVAGRHRRGAVELVIAAVAAASFIIGSARLLQGMNLTQPAGVWMGELVLRILVDAPRIPVIGAHLWALLPIWLLAAFGAVIGIRRRDPLLTTALGGVLLTVVIGVATDLPSPIATILINPWYGARERIAPLMMCLLLVLLATGMARLAARTEESEAGHRRILLRVVTALLAVTVLAGLLVPGRLPLLGSLAYTAYGVQLSPYVTPEEREFIEATAAELPDDAVVLADPRDGATLYWSLGGIGTVYPTMARPQTEDGRLIGRYVTEHDDRELVCGALERMGPTHLYRDTSAYSGWILDAESSLPWAGIRDIPEENLTLVARDGPYALYEFESTC